MRNSWHLPLITGICLIRSLYYFYMVEHSCVKFLFRINRAAPLPNPNKNPTARSAHLATTHRNGGAAPPRPLPPPRPPRRRLPRRSFGRGPPRAQGAGARGRPGRAVVALGLLRVAPGPRARSGVPPRRRPQALAPPLRPVPLRRPRPLRPLHPAFRRISGPECCPGIYRCWA